MSADADDDAGEDEQGTTLPPDETPDAADPNSINRKRRKQKQAEDKVGDFWRYVMSLEIGRAAMWDLLNAAGVFETKFASTPVGFPSNAKTWFHLGEKSLGDRLHRTLMKADPAALMVLYREHHPDFVQPKPPRMRSANATDR